jgi:hypothetical protein
MEEGMVCMFYFCQFLLNVTHFLYPVLAATAVACCGLIVGGATDGRKKPDISNDA